MRFVTLSVSCALMVGGLSGTAYARPSDECLGYSAQNVADIRSHYSSYDRAVVVQQAQVDSQTSWICVHAGLASLAGAGGKFVVTGVALTPVVNNDVSVCPQSGDLLAGQLGDPSNPSTYLPYRVASITDSSTVTVCVTLGSTSVRATYPIISEAPTVDFLPNSGTSYTAPSPVVSSIATGSASSTCTGSSALYSSSSNLVWYSLYGGTEGFVQLSGSNDVCYRAVTPASTRGGVVKYDFGSYNYWLPANTSSPDTCTTVVSSTTAPVKTEIKTGSAPGQSFICVNAMDNTAAVVASTDPQAPEVLAPPSVTHNQD